MKTTTINNKIYQAGRYEVVRLEDNIAPVKFTNRKKAIAFANALFAEKRGTVVIEAVEIDPYGQQLQIVGTVKLSRGLVQWSGILGDASMTLLDFVKSGK